MTGAGIFALMGEAGAIAGNALYLSFIIAGGVALLSGYSLAKLGARYPSAGEIIEYLVQSFGAGFFSGAMGIMLYIVVALAVSGNLDTEQVIKAKDFALAEAAWPVFGATGFIIVAIAAVGSISILIIHLIVHPGHFKVINETGGSFFMLVLAVRATLLSLVFALIYMMQVSVDIIWFIVLALVCAFGTEFFLHKFTARRVQARRQHLINSG